MRPVTDTLRSSIKDELMRALQLVVETPARAMTGVVTRLRVLAPGHGRGPLAQASSPGRSRDRRHAAAGRGGAGRRTAQRVAFQVDTDDLMPAIPSGSIADVDLEDREPAADVWFLVLHGEAMLRRLSERDLELLASGGAAFEVLGRVNAIWLDFRDDSPFHQARQ